MIVYPVTVQELIPTNAYFYIDEDTRHGVLIDPGSEADRLLRVMKKKDFHLDAILLTHGHFDHIGAVEELRKKLNLPVIMEENGKDYAEKPAWNLSASFGGDFILKDVTYKKDGDIIEFPDAPSLHLRLIHTPGHTTDGCIYYDEKRHVAFVGDTIFAGSFGRTDFPGGNEGILFRSIRDKILTLPEETTLLSGHSEPTTVGEEKHGPIWGRR